MIFSNTIPKRDWLSIACSALILITGALGEHEASFRSLLKKFLVLISTAPMTSIVNKKKEKNICSVKTVFPVIYLWNFLVKDSFLQTFLFSQYSYTTRCSFILVTISGSRNSFTFNRKKKDLCCQCSIIITVNSWDIRRCNVFNGELCCCLSRKTAITLHGSRLCLIGIYIQYNWRKIFQSLGLVFSFFSFLWTISCRKAEKKSMSCRGLTDNTRKGHLSLLASVRQTRGGSITGRHPFERLNTVTEHAPTGNEGMPQAFYLVSRSVQLHCTHCSQLS